MCGNLLGSKRERLGKKKKNIITAEWSTKVLGVKTEK